MWLSIVRELFWYNHIQENNTIIGLITYTFFGDICEIVSLDSKKENVGIGSALDEVRKVKPDVPLLGDNDIPLRDEIRIALHRHWWFILGEKYWRVSDFLLNGKETESGQVEELIIEDFNVFSKKWCSVFMLYCQI